jgi:hypothetical protein
MAITVITATQATANVVAYTNAQTMDFTRPIDTLPSYCIDVFTQVFADITRISLVGGLNNGTGLKDNTVTMHLTLMPEENQSLNLSLDEVKHLNDVIVARMQGYGYTVVQRQDDGHLYTVSWSAT